MSVERMLLALPPGTEEGGCTVNQWAGIIEQFSAQGGRELLLGGAEPLAFGGFWVLVRRASRLSLPRITAYLSGSFLEPWVVRQIAESRLHLLVSLDSLNRTHHDALHGPGSHERAMAAVSTLLAHGLGSRLGVLSTATRLTQTDIPALAVWAAARGLSHIAWTTVPDGGWPSPQIRALRLTGEEKACLTAVMEQAGRALGDSFRTAPLEVSEDPLFSATGPRILRVKSTGDACWGFAGDGPSLGNLRRATLQSLVDRAAQAAGD